MAIKFKYFKTENTEMMMKMIDYLESGQSKNYPLIEC